MKIMSFNLRVDVLEDGVNAFSNRLNAITAFLNKENPDVIGFQEVRPNMLESLIKMLHNYAYVGEPRALNDEYNPIFYKKNYTKKHTQTFWFGDTPNIKGSKHPDAYFPRIFTTLTLTINKTNYEFVNTHFSHISHIARVDSLKTIVDYYIARKTKLPFILMGDFNAHPTQQVNEILSPHLDSCWNHYFDDNLTFHGFSDLTKGDPIDYIWVDKSIIIDTVTIYKEKVNNQYLSDHYPISIVINNT
jgi:endonuclease/exonuclease/phosphatase family metal-dependent hydrolase